MFVRVGDEGTYELLMQRRAACMSAPHTWCVPGGSFESHEKKVSRDRTLHPSKRWKVRRSTIMREIREECGSLPPGIQSMHRDEDRSTWCIQPRRSDGSYDHTFYFLYLLTAVDDQWDPRASPNFRFEVDEDFPYTQFGYRWFLLKPRGSVCDCKQAKFECCRCLPWNNLTPWLRPLLIHHWGDILEGLEILKNRRKDSSGAKSNKNKINVFGHVDPDELIMTPRSADNSKSKQTHRRPNRPLFVVTKILAALAKEVQSEKALTDSQRLIVGMVWPIPSTHCFYSLCELCCRQTCDGDRRNDSGRPWEPGKSRVSHSFKTSVIFITWI